jgi:hypothetical protein
MKGNRKVTLTPRRAPRPVFGRAAAHDVEEQRAQARGHRSHLAGAHGTVVDARDRGDLRRRAGQEDLVCQEELTPFDRTLFDRQAQFLAQKGDERPARDAFQDALIERRRDRDPAPDEEDVLARALADAPVAVEQDGLVEPGQLGVALGKGAVDVAARDLPARRNHVVVGPAPGRDRAMRALGLVDVEAEGQGHRGQTGRQAVQPHADDLVAVESQCADVAILAQSLGAQQVEQGRRGRFFRKGQVHAQQAGRFVEAPHVVGQAKHEELALVLVEVAADAREHPGAVVERVGQQPQLRFGVGQDAVVKESHAGKSHRCLLESNLESN